MPRTTDRHRVFFALWPESEVRAQIAAAVKEAVAASDGRPVPPERLHLTLAFLGEVDATAVEEARRAARNVSIERFSMVLDRLGYWSQPRINWLAPSDVPGALYRLADELWGALGEVGFERELRPYRPHVSLVRGGSGRLDLRIRDAEEWPVHWTVDGFALIESKTGPDARSYTVLEHFSADD